MEGRGVGKAVGFPTDGKTSRKASLSQIFDGLSGDPQTSTAIFREDTTTTVTTAAAALGEPTPIVIRVSYWRVQLQLE